MCYPVTCKTCSKTTWAGCGQHVADVRRAVPSAQWCGGHPKQEQSNSGNFLSRLFGRS